MFNIQSEVLPLKKVILHRPYESLLKLTPENCDELLFDDVLWPKKANEEHDVFANTLRKEGVDVFYITDLLTESLQHSDAKDFLVQSLMAYSYHGSRVEAALSEYLLTQPADALANMVIGGLTIGDVANLHLGLVTEVGQPQDFLLPPLPNHLFTRDSSFWLGRQVAISSMHFDARKTEAINLKTIYQFHPMFALDSASFCYHGMNKINRAPYIEGGDVLVLNQETIMIGMGQRSTPQAIEALARHLFTQSTFKRIIAVAIPKARSSMHLDTLMTMADHDTFCVGTDIQDLHSWTLEASDSNGQFNVKRNDNFVSTLEKALGVSALRMISVGGDYFIKQQEQWCDASNLLAVRPGVVIGYERNEATNERLDKANIQVLAIPGSELGRGRGGGRCMSCPILREA